MSDDKLELRWLKDIPTDCDFKCKDCETRCVDDYSLVGHDNELSDEKGIMCHGKCNQCSDIMCEFREVDKSLAK